MEKSKQKVKAEFESKQNLSRKIIPSSVLSFFESGLKTNAQCR